MCMYTRYLVVEVDILAPPPPDGGVEAPHRRQVGVVHGHDAEPEVTEVSSLLGDLWPV